MKRLQYYVLREHLRPFFFGLVLIFFIFILNLLLEIMKMILKVGVPPLIILKYIIYNLAWMGALAVPMAVLVATVMAFGRLSSDVEFTAMKASGVSLYRIMTPVFLTSIVIAIALVIFNHRVLPEANQRILNLRLSISSMKPTIALQEGKFQQIVEGLEVFAEKINNMTGEVEGVIILDKRDSKTDVTITAPRGIVSISPGGTTATINLFEGEIHQTNTGQDQYMLTRFPRYQFYLRDLPLTGFRLKQRRSRTDRSMTTKALLDNIDRNKKRLEAKKKLLDEAERSEESEQEITKLKKGIIVEQKIISKYSVEVHKKNSIPVAAIIFTLIGVPLGAMVRRSGASIGISLSIGFFILYWSFLIGGEDLADRLMIPAWLAMWSPNMLLGAVGVFLTVMAARK